MARNRSHDVMSPDSSRAAPARVARISATHKPPRHSMASMHHIRLVHDVLLLGLACRLEKTSRMAYRSVFRRSLIRQRKATHAHRGLPTPLDCVKGQLGYTDQDLRRDGADLSRRS